MQQITLVDYNSGNIQTVKRKINRLGVEVVLSNDPNEIRKAEKIILPGVGHFGNAMDQLDSLYLTEALNELALVKKRPILGICLGMQLMAKKSEEGNVSGLSWVDGTIVRFQVQDTLNFKVPHMGWNSISIEKESTLMNGIPEDSSFYFVHSYHFSTANPGLILNKTDYSYPFVSAIEQDNIFGVQYHPEKSHDIGELLLKNFITL